MANIGSGCQAPDAWFSACLLTINVARLAVCALAHYAMCKGPLIFLTGTLVN